MTLTINDPLFNDIGDSLGIQIPMGITAARDEIALYLQNAASPAGDDAYTGWLCLNTALLIAHAYMVHRGTSPVDLGLDETRVEQVRTLKSTLAYKIV